MKIGIVTIFHNNYNYGAVLQAYALAKVIQSKGKEVEVINYYDSTLLRYLLFRIKQKTYSFLKKNFAKRKKNISDFKKKNIPQSRLFYKNTINKIINYYDVFVAGSDQIWNPNYINDFYKLNFVKNKKSKFSYAASIGKQELTESQKQEYKIFLENFNKITVRETEGLEIINSIDGLKSEVVLDPTLLLGFDDWSSICNKNLINKKYIFCYFLNDSIEHRKLASEYAEKHHLDIVVIPNLSLRERRCDDLFGNYKINDASPRDFLSLIKNAECIITDSFHATVFSHIFKKEFFVIDDFKTSTSSRIKTLTDLFGTTNRFICSHSMFNINYLESQPPIVYKNNEKFDLMKEKSFSFLDGIMSE